MIVEGFDNAWHILRHWAESGYEYFALDTTARIPEPRPLASSELAAAGLLGLDYLPIPPLSTREGHGDNPDPERPLTIAEIALATAIAEGWEPDTGETLT
ncbi:MAG TPA: hypothetical protein VGW12_21650 [Pyrinomonadaceae bacterium]|nr:hypothetical protein [Pyrinomonadaceae bacterium]